MIGDIARNPTLKRWSAYLSVAAIVVPLIIIIFGWSPIVRSTLSIVGLVTDWANSLVDVVQESLGSLQSPNSDG